MNDQILGVIIGGAIGIVASLIGVITQHWLELQSGLSVALDIETTYIEEGELRGAPDNERLWINIVNETLRRLKVSSVWLEWSRFKFPRIKTEKDVCDYPHFQRGDESAPNWVNQFWVEPGGDVILSADYSDLPYWLRNRGARNIVWLKCAVRDAMGNWHRSKAIKVQIPSGPPQA